MRNSVVVFGLMLLLSGCTEIPVERYVSTRECAIAGAVDAATCDRLITAAVERYYTSARRFATLSACITSVDGTCHLVRQRKQRAGLSNAYLCERQADGRYIARPVAYEIELGPQPRAWAIGAGTASTARERRPRSLLSLAYALLEPT